MRSCCSYVPRLSETVGPVKLKMTVLIFSLNTQQLSPYALTNCPGKVETSQSEVYGHWLSAVVYCEGIFVILVHVYG